MKQRAREKGKMRMEGGDESPRGWREETFSGKWSLKRWGNVIYSYFAHLERWNDETFQRLRSRNCNCTRRKPTMHLRYATIMPLWMLPKGTDEASGSQKHFRAKCIAVSRVSCFFVLLKRPGRCKKSSWRGTHVQFLPPVKTAKIVTNLSKKILNAFNYRF